MKALRNTFVALLFAMLLSSCVQTATQKAVEQIIKPQLSQAELLKANSDLWRSKQVKNYNFTLRADCLCPLAPRSPVRIDVRNGQPVSIVTLNRKNTFYFVPEAYKDYNTIDKMFERIEEAPNSRPEFISASYHETLGYPTSFTVDQTIGGSDDEMTILIEDFGAADN